MKKEELQQLIEDNVKVYKDFNEFEKYTNYTREDVKNELYYGLFSELTPAKGKTILDALEKRVTQNSFISLEKCLNDMDLNNQVNLNDTTALIKDYLKMYSIYYIESDKRYLSNNN